MMNTISMPMLNPWKAAACEDEPFSSAVRVKFVMSGTVPRPSPYHKLTHDRFDRSDQTEHVSGAVRMMTVAPVPYDPVAQTNRSEVRGDDERQCRTNEDEQQDSDGRHERNRQCEAPAELRFPLPPSSR